MYFTKISKRCAWLLVSFVCLAPVVIGQSSVKPPQVALSSCNIPGITGTIRCGTYDVFENRITKAGRKITLKIVVLSATSDQRAPDPVVFLAGGPGSSSTNSEQNVATGLAGIRKKHDLVFVDQRGTGGSHPLNCDLYDHRDLRSYFGPVFPAEDIRKCREQLEPVSDLTLYTTPIAMDDLDEVRSALGYERVNLLGASYGTRAALVYLKRHPKSVRTMTLQGVSPTNEFVPLKFAQSNERALQGIITACDLDEPCHRAFPDLHSEVKAVLERLIRGPVEVTVPNSNPESGGGVGNTNSSKITINRDRVAEGIRFMLYFPGLASRVPLLLHLAAAGDFGPIAQAVLAYRRLIKDSVSTGLYLSITCAEDVPWIKPGEGERLAANTFLGDNTLRQLREACKEWPRAPIPAAYKEPTRSSVPVLIFTGQLDPVTPPANGDAVARNLPNSLHIVVPNGGHDFGDLEGIDCLVRLQTEFVDRGAGTGLDTSCVKNIKRRGFALER